jgi:hypothetical protein
MVDIATLIAFGFLANVPWWYWGLVGIIAVQKFYKWCKKQQNFKGKSNDKSDLRNEITIREIRPL